MSWAWAGQALADSNGAHPRGVKGVRGGFLPIFRASKASLVQTGPLHLGHP